MPILCVVISITQTVSSILLKFHSFVMNIICSWRIHPFTLSIVTAPAPNLNGTRPEGLQYKLRGLIRGRIERVLHIAAAHGHKNIILGAWGCGAFGNDPQMMAEEFKKMVEKVSAFEHVCFAVYDTRTPTHLFDTFNDVFRTTP